MPEGFFKRTAPPPPHQKKKPLHRCPSRLGSLCDSLSLPSLHGFFLLRMAFQTKGGSSSQGDQFDACHRIAVAAILIAADLEPRGAEGVGVRGVPQQVRVRHLALRRNFAPSWGRRKTASRIRFLKFFWEKKTSICPSSDINSRLEPASGQCCSLAGGRYRE